jgi:hypothetical protein
MVLVVIMVLNMGILIMFRRSKYLLATVVAFAVLMLPVVMPAILSTSNVSAETMDEARENAIRYSYTAAVKYCIDNDQLHKDDDHIQLGQSPQEWMKDFTVNVGYVVDNEDGERQCNNLITGALKAFGYDANSYGDFFKDMGYRCSTTSCQFSGSTADQTHNFQTVVSRKKLPTTATAAMNTLLYLTAFQTKCEAEEVTDPNAAAVEDAINLRNDTTVVYYAKSESGVLTATPTVYKYDTNNYARIIGYGLRYNEQNQCSVLAPKLRDASKAAAEQQVKEFSEKKRELYLEAAIKAACGESSTSPGYIRCSDGVKAAFPACYARAFGGGTGTGSGGNPDDVATKGDQGLANCLAAATGTSADTYMTAFQSVKAELDALANSYQTSTSTQTDDSDDCPLPSDAEMRWLGCAVFGLLRKATETLHDYIQQFLYVSVSNVFNDNIKTVSNSFRAIAIGIIVIAGLTMVISQALGFELFDAYTIKKLLPRLIVALLGVALAWPLMKLLVILFNDLGLSMGSVLDKVSGYGTTSTDGVGAGSVIISVFFGGAAVRGTVWAMGVLGGLSLIGTAVLSMFVGMIVLAVRQVMILMCVILAPFAIACYVLPGTQKVWAFWKNTFMTALFMYPIIMLFIGAGRAASAIIGSNGSSGAMNILAIMLYFAPYFMLPYAFKMAGGLMSTIFGLANDRGRGAFDRMKKFRGNQTGKRMQHRSNRLGRATAEKQASVQRAMKARYDRSGRLGKVLYGRGASMLDGYQGNLEARVSEYQAAAKKTFRDQIENGMDDEQRGLTVDKAVARAQGEITRGTNVIGGNHYAVGQNESSALMRISASGATEYKTLGGAWVGESSVDRAYARWGSDVNTQQEALLYEMSKAQTPDQVRDLKKRYARLAQGAWKMDETQAGGAWIGASFGYQQQNISYKNTDWKSGDLKFDGQSLLGETYHKRDSYNLAHMDSEAIDSLSAAYEESVNLRGDAMMRLAINPGDAAATRDLQKSEEAIMQGKGIAELFMHNLSGGQQIGVTGSNQQPVTNQPGQPGQPGSRQVGTPGPAAVAEAVHRFATITGVSVSQDGTVGGSRPQKTP